MTAARHAMMPGDREVEMALAVRPGLDVRPVSGALGVEVRGMRIDRLDDEGFAALHALVLEHLVVFLPGQSPTNAAHVALGRRFGPLEVHPFLPKPDPDHPEIVELRSDEGYTAKVWHTDVTFSGTPPLCSVLHMVDVPPAGGDTMFSNQYRALDTLSEPLRDLLRACTAEHSAAPFGHPEQRVEHPVVRVHPETGRESLFVNRGFTERIVQLAPSESDVLLAFLFAHSEQPAVTCRYRWSPGTVAVWDNRCTQHCVVDDFAGPRTIRRVTVPGDAPRAAGATDRFPARQARGHRWPGAGGD